MNTQNSKIAAMDWRQKDKKFWLERLTPQQFKITREGGTERAFTGEYWDQKDPGIYKCLCCETPLFDAATKFDSGSGWPSFFNPIMSDSGEDPIQYKTDRSWLMVRTEVLCNTCGAHLGHVFDDGPPPTGKRYCINSTALKFEKR